MANELATYTNGATPSLMPQIMESVLLAGDLQKLSSQQRVSFYGSVCESLHLNPLTKPFEYIVLNNKMTLYTTKNCTDQLRARDNISIKIVSRDVIDGIYVVTAGASAPSGRTDESTGAVAIDKLSGESRANAYMKAETKAKRRVTLSICGLSMPDESEIETIPGARRVRVGVNGDIEGHQDEPIDTGGHPVGTQAAADYVADKKIAEMQKPKGNGKSPDYYKMLESFKGMKDAIGEEAYYRILGINGYEKSNLIPDVPTGKRIWKEMEACRRAQAEVKPEASAAPDPTADAPVADMSDLPDEMFPGGRK